MAVQTKVGAAAGVFYYTYTDHLGSVVALSSGNTYIGASLARHDPFGNYRTTPATTNNPDKADHGFTGHRMNNTGSFPTQNVGLIYMNARYYMPEIGRFISADTIVPEPGNPQSYNRYSYGYNNPVKYVDPSGHCGAEAAASGDDSYYVGLAEYQECLGLKHEVEGLLGHTISGIWYLWQMQAMHEGSFSLAAQGLPLGPSLTSSEHRAALLALTQYWAQTDVTSLEISARVVEFGFVLGSTIEDLIAVLSGHEGTGLVGRSPSEGGDFSSGEVLANRDSGFNDFYGDPDPANNQVHHTWFWIQMGYYHDYFTAMAGNIWHEIDPSADKGRSWSDFRVGVWGIAVGTELKNGQPDLFNLAQDLRVFLGR